MDRSLRTAPHGSILEAEPGGHGDGVRGPPGAHAAARPGHGEGTPVPRDSLARPTGKGRTRWAMRWKPALNAFAITFAGHIVPSNASYVRCSGRRPRAPP